MLTLPSRLAALRTIAGLTAQDLGELAGLSKGTVSMIESGRRPNPASSTVDRLCRTLGDESGWLLSGRGDPPSRERVLASVGEARASRPHLPTRPDPERGAA